jgi:hypothetical protein
MIDGIISISGGAVACYYGFRKPPVSRDAVLAAKWRHWHQRWGMWQPNNEQRFDQYCQIAQIFD